MKNNNKPNKLLNNTFGFCNSCIPKRKTKNGSKGQSKLLKWNKIEKKKYLAISSRVAKVPGPNASKRCVRGGVSSSAFSSREFERSSLCKSRNLESVLKWTKNLNLLCHTIGLLGLLHPKGLKCELAKLKKN